MKTWTSYIRLNELPDPEALSLPVAVYHEEWGRGQLLEYGAERCKFLRMGTVEPFETKTTMLLAIVQNFKSDI